MQSNKTFSVYRVGIDGSTTLYLDKRDAIGALIDAIDAYGTGSSSLNTAMTEVLTRNHRNNVFDNVIQFDDGDYDSEYELRFSCMPMTNDDIENLPNGVFTQLVDKVNDYVTSMHQEHDDYITSHIDSASEYKRVLIDYVRDAQCYDVSESLKRYGLSVDNDLLCDLWESQAEYFTTIQWYDGYASREKNCSIRGISISESEYQLSYDVPQAIAEKLDYYVSDDLLTVNHWGFYELQLDIVKFLECLSDAIA